MPVSNLQPATKGPLAGVRAEVSDSECVDLGDAAPDGLVGDGEREGKRLSCLAR